MAELGKKVTAALSLVFMACMAVGKSEGEDRKCTSNMDCDEDAYCYTWDGVEDLHETCMDCPPKPRGTCNAHLGSPGEEEARGNCKAVCESEMDGCDEDVPCSELTTASGLTFQCRTSGPPDGTAVVLLHGFPSRSRFWIPLMRHWVDNHRPYRVVACDLRGYSPKAAPADISAYHYDHLVADVYEIADAMSFSTFHLVGHDHGAGVGWVAVTHTDALARVLSYSALAVPHLDASSKALYGDEADEQHQVAFNYVNQFAQPDSATLWTLAQMAGHGFHSAQAFQKSLWWYNGSVGLKFARPPVLPDEVVAKYDGVDWLMYLRNAMPLPVDSGAPASEGPIGSVSLPVTFLCGTMDPYVLCTRSSMTATGNYVAGTYTSVMVACDHDVLSSCESDAESIKSMEAITAQIEQVSPSPAGEAEAPSQTQLPGASLASFGQRHSRLQLGVVSSLAALTCCHHGAM